MLRDILISFQVCDNGHTGHKWCSQPRLAERGLHAGDFCLTMNVLLSGNNFQKIALLVRFMRLGTLSQSLFTRVQGLYCVPAIERFWADIQRDTLHKLAGQKLYVAGMSEKRPMKRTHIHLIAHCNL